MLSGCNGGVMEDSSVWSEHYQEDTLACRNWFTLLRRLGQSGVDRCWEKKDILFSVELIFLSDYSPGKKDA